MEIALAFRVKKPILLIASGIFFISALFLDIYLLDVLEKIATIVAAVSFFTAVLQFQYLQKKDKQDSIFKILSFFRENVLSEYNKLVKEVPVKFPDYKFKLIRFKRRESLDEIFAREWENAKAQSQLLEREINTFQLNLLNVLEEFSLRVIELKLEENNIISCLKYAFVRAVEENTISLLVQRIIITDDEKLYNGILTLYEMWRDQTNMDIESRIDKLKIKPPSL
ncbi:MAG TPA: hypothetical protein VGE63_02720 [Candidatus Paceibacterota bacterium]